MDKVQIYQELERRGELGKLPPEKQAIWAEYKRRQSPSAPAETPGQKAWNSFKEDIADLTYAPRKALSGATLKSPITIHFSSLICSKIVFTAFSCSSTHKPK